MKMASLEMTLLGFSGKGAKYREVMEQTRLTLGSRRTAGYPAGV